MVFQDPYGSLHPRQTVDRLLSEPVLVHRMGDIDKRISRGLAEVAPAAEHPLPLPAPALGRGSASGSPSRGRFMSEPDVVLLDEPTSALDVSVQAEVLNLLADSAGEARADLCHGDPQPGRGGASVQPRSP